MNRNSPFRNRVFLFWCVATLLFTLSVTQAVAQCNKLGEFRDGKLYQQYKVSFEKYQVFDDVLADVRTLKRELESSKWTTSDVAWVSSGLISTLGISAKAIVDGLALAAGPAGRAIDLAACSAHEFVEFSKGVS